MPTKEQRTTSRNRRKLKLAWCSSCKVDKPWEEFDPSPGRRPFGLTSRCTKCENERKARQKRNKYWQLDEAGRKQSNRKINLKKCFGLTIEGYDEILAAQGGVCAICKKTESSAHCNVEGQMNLAVDHDHATGEIRGLLCANCNRGIGFFKEDPAIIESAASYIRKHKQPAEPYEKPTIWTAVASNNHTVLDKLDLKRLNTPPTEEERKRFRERVEKSREKAQKYKDAFRRGKCVRF